MRSLAVLIVAAFLATGCKPPSAGQGKQNPWAKGNKDQVKNERVFLAPVIVDAVSRADVEAAVSTTGNAVPIRSRLLRAEESGRLIFDKPWREGDFVAKDEQIAHIVSETLEGEIRVAIADVDIAREQLEIGKRSMDSAIREYRTLQDLYSRGIAAGKEVDRTELEMQRAINSQRQNEINLEKAESRLRSLRAREERLSIRSPFDGLIVSKATLEGTNAITKSFGRETITDFDGRMIGAEFSVAGVVDASEMLVRTDVTSKDISLIREGQKSRVSFYATEDFIVEGTVQSISNAVNPETRAFSVDVLVSNPEGRLKPGMFGRVETIVETRRDAISIPKSVIARRNNREVVYVAEKRAETGYDVAVEREIELGLEGRDEIEVKFGLKEGDRLIVRGFEVLQNNTPVNVTDIDAPTTGTMELVQETAASR